MSKIMLNHVTHAKYVFKDDIKIIGNCQFRLNCVFREVFTSGGRNRNRTVALKQLRQLFCFHDILNIW